MGFYWLNVYIAHNSLQIKSIFRKERYADTKCQRWFEKSSKNGLHFVRHVWERWRTKRKLVNVWKVKTQQLAKSYISNFKSIKQNLKQTFFCVYQMSYVQMNWQHCFAFIGKPSTVRKMFDLLFVGYQTK